MLEPMEQLVYDFARRCAKRQNTERLEAVHFRPGKKPEILDRGSPCKTILIITGPDFLERRRQSFSEGLLNSCR